MKQLCTVSTMEEGQRIQSLLEDKGIPISIRGGPSVENIRQMYAPIFPTLYVCLDPQFEDAQAILRDPLHEVAEPVDAAQFHRDIEADGMKSVLSYLLVPGLIAIAVCLLVITLLYLY